MHGLKDGNSKSESQRPSGASPPPASSSHLMNLLEEDLGLPSKMSTGSDLARIAPLTSEAMARLRATEAETIGATKGTTEEGT